MTKLRCLFLPTITLVAFAGLLIAPKPALADVTTFSVTGTFGNGASFAPGSTITIDTVLGTAVDSNLLITTGSNSPANTFTGVPNTDDGSFKTPFIWDLSDGTDLMMYEGSVVGYQGFGGGLICCVFYSNPPVWGFSNGSFNTVLAPEPSEITLLAIGSLAAMASLRKRFPRLGR